MSLVDRVERTVCRPAFVLAVGVLLINDHLLKGSGLLPGWMTGKLSDVAGLFFFPILLVILTVRLIGVRDTDQVQRLFVGAAAVTVAVFSTLNLFPVLAEDFSRIWGVWTPDPTDLICLPIVGLAGHWFMRSLEDDAPRVGSGRLARLALVTLASVASLATSPPPAETPDSKLLNPSDPSLDFVDSSVELIVTTPDQGIVRLGLDGTDRKQLVPAGSQFRAFSYDGSRFIFSRSDVPRSAHYRQHVDGGQLERVAPSGYSFRSVSRTGATVAFSRENRVYVCRDCEGQPTWVVDFETGVEAAEVSPDGTLMAVKRESINPNPVWWRVEHGLVEQRPSKLYLVDTTTGNFEIVMDNAESVWGWGLVWSLDGKRLYVEPEGSNPRRYRLDRESWESVSASEVASEDLFRRPESNPMRCSNDSGRYDIKLAGGRQGLEGLKIVRDDGTEERIVDLKITGSLKEDQRYRSPIGNVFFPGDCNYVVFWFDGALRVVDVKTHTVGKLIEGSGASVLKAIR